MQENRLSYLLSLYANNKASKEEIKEMFALLDQDGQAPELKKLVLADRQELYKTEPLKKRNIKWMAYAAAASLFIIASLIVYRFGFAPTNQKNTTVVLASAEVKPGTEKAILTLSDGRRVQLDSATSESIVDGTLSIKNLNGQLTYSDPERGSISPAGGSGAAGAEGGLLQGRKATNTMTTPRGGQYQLTLADGTNVWLNAASSITFPVAFTGQKREVNITGEVYFDVQPDKKKPFIVNTASQQIEVLGTSFNVNAYEDEGQVMTSLDEGKVKVTAGGAVKIITPGEDARLKGNVLVTGRFAKDAAAWKKGYFYFAATPLTEVMRQLSRWYDIHVTYSTNKISEIKFDGRMGRNLQLQQVLRGLSQMGVKFKMEGRNLIVL